MKKCILEFVAGSLAVAGAILAGIDQNWSNMIWAIGTGAFIGYAYYWRKESEMWKRTAKELAGMISNLHKEFTK